MELSSSSEAVNCAAAQELPRILWNQNINYRVRKNPPLVPILCQINPIHPILSKIHFDIAYQPTSWSSQLSLSFCPYHQYPISMPLLPIRATFSSHLILVQLIILVILGEE
jgi:hypothetical protein